MFKFLLVWLLVNYSYENISDTYKTYKTENPIKESNKEGITSVYNNFLKPLIYH